MEGPRKLLLARHSGDAFHDPWSGATLLTQAFEVEKPPCSLLTEKQHLPHGP